jgi:hypothetical protein
MRTIDYSKWWYWELLKAKRRYSKYDMEVVDIRFEINRRERKWKTWAIWLGFLAGGIGIIAAILSLSDKYVGY